MVAKLLRISARLYVTGITLWAVLFLLLADHPWWMFVAASFGPFLFAPVPLLLIAAWRLDRWSWWGSLGLALLALALYGPQLRPPSWREAPRPGGARLTVLTFNLHYQNRRLDQIPDFLAASGADVIVLQEVRPAVARYLRRAVRDVYPYTVLDEETPEIRPGILSKHPLGDVARPPELGWTACTATLRLDGLPVRVVGLHYPVSFPGRIGDTVARREEQAAALVRFLREHPEPTVVAGDFNTTPLSGLHRTLVRGGLRDSWQEAGAGFGHTWGFPRARRPPLWFVRIDYVWVTEHWDVATAEVRPWDGSSDHRGVRAELVLRSPAATAPRAILSSRRRTGSCAAPSFFPGLPIGKDELKGQRRERRDGWLAHGLLLAPPWPGGSDRGAAETASYAIRFPYSAAGVSASEERESVSSGRAQREDRRSGRRRP